MPAAIRAQIEVTVAGSPEELWPFVADTDRIDRASGLPPVHFRREQRREGGEIAIGEYRLLGWPIARWLEHSFEWQFPRCFSVLREYQCGPLTRFCGGTELLQLDEHHTRLRSFVELTPRFAWLAPVLRFGLAPVGLRRAARQHRAIGRYLRAQSSRESAFPALAQMRTPAHMDRLAERMRRLLVDGAPADPARRLGEVLATAADEDVAGMRPLELAQRWRTDPRQTLEAFIRATLVGLVELRWELLCPRCRGAKATATHLRDLASGGLCPTCNLHFFATVDEAIEARFYPNPSIRNVDVGTYCVGSPMKTPHRLAQAELTPGESRTWQLALHVGTYAVSSPQSAKDMRVQVEDGQAAGALGAIRIDRDGPAPEEIHVRPGRVQMDVSNMANSTISVALDDTRWSELGATPGKLMTLPAFGAFLSREALAPGFELAIGRVGLLFTDLAGSTALYERIGDARAFKLVGEHFTLLSQPIERNGGAIIKTIGDAVMAAFPDGRSALAAALDMQSAIRSLQTDGVVDAARLIKVGVHVGACYAVTLNDRLDYFGSTVNLAARAQNEAHGGEIVATQAALEEGRSELESHAMSWESFDVELKGFSAPVRLYRIDAARA